MNVDIHHAYVEIILDNIITQSYNDITQCKIEWDHKGDENLDNKIKRLGDAELEIMLVIWNEKVPVTSSFILEHLHERRNWALSTLMSTLARLADKGFVHCDRTTRTNYYSALISEEIYKQRESSSFLEKLHGNSVKNLVASLYENKAFSDKDLKELRNLIDELERRNLDA